MPLFIAIVFRKEEGDDTEMHRLEKIHFIICGKNQAGDIATGHTAQCVCYKNYRSVGRQPLFLVASPEPIYGKNASISCCQELALVLWVIKPFSQDCIMAYKPQSEGLGNPLWSDFTSNYVTQRLKPLEDAFFLIGIRCFPSVEPHFEHEILLCCMKAGWI